MNLILAESSPTAPGRETFLFRLNAEKIRVSPERTEWSRVQSSIESPVVAVTALLKRFKREKMNILSHFLQVSLKKPFLKTEKIVDNFISKLSLD